jgi:hypothetical protein
MFSDIQAKDSGTCRMLAGNTQLHLLVDGEKVFECEAEIT